MSELLSGAPFLSAVATLSIKGSALIVLVALIQWLGRDRIPPAWRHAMWLLVVLRLIVPAGPESRLSLFNVLGSVPSIEKSAPAVGATKWMTFERTEELPAPARIAPNEAVGLAPAALAMLAFWGAGALLLLARITTSSTLLSRRIESDRDSGGSGRETLAAAKDLLDRSRERMKIRREVDVIETTSVTSPALHGFIRPRILLPPGVLEHFDSEELEYIFLHELAHLRRHDVALNLITSVVQAVHWFNPLVWLAFSRMREERELACDELALAVLRQDERPRYGRTILKLLESFHSPGAIPALVGITNHKEQMRRRITMIATFQKHSRKSLAFAAMLFMIGAVSLTEAQSVDAPRVRMLKAHAPEASPTIERLDTSISLDLAQVSIEEIFNAVSNRTGVNVRIASELVPTIGTMDRLTIKADNVPAHMALIHAAAAVGLAVDFDADGAIVTKSDGAHPRVMFLKKEGEAIDVLPEMIAADGSKPRMIFVGKEGDENEVRHEVTRVMIGSGGEAVVSDEAGEAGEKKVKVHVIHKKADGDKAEAVSAEEIEKIIEMHAPSAEGARRRIHVVAPEAGTSGTKTHLEINRKDAGTGTTSKGTLDIEVHRDQAAM